MIEQGQVELDEVDRVGSVQNRAEFLESDRGGSGQDRVDLGDSDQGCSGPSHLPRATAREVGEKLEEMEGKQHLPQTRHRNSSLLGLFAPSNCYLQEPYQDGNDSVDILQVFDDNASILSQSSRVSSFKASAVTFNN